MSLVIRGGQVIDANGERISDVLIEGDRIADVGPDLDPGEARVLDATGCVVSPGLVDLHTHLREPGREEAETVLTGSRAAALGGFTAVQAMPNTEPPLDDVAVVRSVQDRARDALCEVVVAGAITKGRQGIELAPMGEMHDAGVRVFTDDGDCVGDTLVMRRALEYATALDGAIVAQHAEDPDLVAHGHMHEGEWSARLGIPGRPGEAESIVIARDLDLVRRTGARYHVMHLSTAAGLELVRAAKAEGLPVTTEVTPQHLVLTHALCASFDPVFKMNPPLRTDGDVAALVGGVVDGTIDAIATDHAPHAPETKERPFEEAPPGMLGLETALAVAITALVEPGHCDLSHVLGALSWRPAAILGLEDQGRDVAEGAVANLCVFDPSAAWEVERERLASRSRNTPWQGRTLTGRVRHTIFRGEPVVVDAKALR